SGLGCLLPRWRRRRVRVLLLEAIDAPLRVDQLLLSGEERMAVAADVEMQVAVRRPGLPGGSARAVHLGGRVGGVDVLAHVCFSLTSPRDCSRASARGLPPGRKGCESIADRWGKINLLTSTSVRTSVR